MCTRVGARQYPAAAPHPRIKSEARPRPSPRKRGEGEQLRLGAWPRSVPISRGNANFTGQTHVSAEGVNRANPLHRARPHARARRPHRGASTGRLGRQCHQGRAAGAFGGGRDPRGCAPRARLPEPASQQALRRPQPEIARGRGSIPAVGGEGRRGDRELSPRRQEAPGHRLCDVGQAQPAPRLCFDLGLRPGWALRRPSRASTRSRRAWAA